MRREKLFLALILAVALSHAAVPPRPYHVEHYDVRLDIDIGAKRVVGEVAIHFRPLVHQLSEVELDAGELEIVSVREGQFSRRDHVLTVTLKHALKQDERGKLTIRYRAAPARGLKFYPNQVYTAFFTNDWMVCNDRPEDRATLRLTISGPAAAKVAASGRLVKQRAGVSEWALDAPTPPFVFGFAVGDFVESSTSVGDVKLRYLGRTSADATVSGATEAAMRFLIDKSGMAFPGATYTQVFAQGNAEQEVAAFTLLPESYQTKLAAHPDDLWLLAHELAHQWYGIAITCQDWSDFWLNEGMATFLADAFLEQRFGRERYEREIADSRKTYESLKSQGKDRPLSYHDWTTTQQAGGRLPYTKGAWFLHLLREQVGDEAFWRGLRTYTKDHWGKAVVSADFQKSMESATGTSLSALFNEWVYAR